MTAPDDLARTLAEHLRVGTLGDCSCGLHSDWPSDYVSHLASVVSRRDADLRTRIEAVRELEAGTHEVKPYEHGDDVSGYCGKLAKTVTKHVRLLNHNDPKEQLAVFCSTTSCSCSMKVSDLPTRYQVTEAQFQAAAAKAVRDHLSRRPADTDTGRGQ